MNLCIVAVGASSIIEVKKICRRWESGDRAGRVALSAYYVGSEALEESGWPPIFQSISGADFVLLDTMGVPQAFSDALVEGVAGCAGHIVVANATTVAVRALTRLGRFSLGLLKRMAGGDSVPDPGRMLMMAERMERLGRAVPVGPLRDMRNFFLISRYWLSGTPRNLENMLYLIGREYFGYKDFPRPAPPHAVEDCTIMDPGTRRIFASVAELRAACPPAPGRPGLGLLFRSRSYPLDTHPLVARMLARFSELFNVIPLALDSTLGRDFGRLRALLMPEGTSQIDVLINPEAFRLAQGPMGGDAGQGEAFLRDLNVPVLHPFFLTKRTRTQWLSDARGTEVGEFLISMFLPELDGCIEMYPIGAVGTPEGQTPELKLIEERVEHLAQRALAWSRLRRTPNRDKRVAVIFYNYPPGEASAGSSSFLDTFASIAALLETLAARGYAVAPMTAEELRKAFIAGGVLNAPAWQNSRQASGPVVDGHLYQVLTRDLPGRETIDERWGPFPGSPADGCSGVGLPGILNGNVFIGVQPARGTAGAACGAYHDKHAPPHHQYVAFYRWLEREFRAHAVVHVGTHGTLEFLPGKEKALSGDCFPDALLGRMPHLYVYYSGNPSEAMVARRRAHAVLIGHLPPPFVRGDLYDDLLALQALAQEHAEARNLNPQRCAAILDDIRGRVAALGWEWAGLEDLHRRLYEIESALVPARLHTLGRGYSEDEAVGYCAAVFRQPGEGTPSLHALLAAQQGWDWETLSAAPHLHAERIGELDHVARQWIVEHVLQGRPASGGSKHPAADLIRRGESIIKALMHNSELDGLARALNGEYLRPGLGGDLFRSPEILPTGRNLVQFDPRQVPSPSAVRQGAQIAAGTIARHRQAHGRYPRSTAVILWGLETSQTQGETVGQILGYLGVRVVRVSGQWDPRLEVVGLEELGRPRIDVTVQICGFFRDMFPTTLALLQSAFGLAGFADEPDELNYVRANARLHFEALRGEGMPESAAREFALARVFGPASSAYGTEVERLVKSRAWQSEADLVAAYMESLKHAYTPNHYGVAMGDLLNSNLQQVEVVSQVRSSREYEMTDLDHYYEFFGGLSRSVEQASGKKAMLLISDSHEGRVRTEDVREAVQRGVCARLTNPAWLSGMLAHPHHGGHELAKRMENLIGLAATTGSVDSATFDRVNSRLVFDEDMRRRIQHNNPYALFEIVSRLREAHSRGYWSPEGETLEKLQHISLGIESHLEGLQP